MVRGMLLHCKSLRRFKHGGGWIKALLEEAENERMHLMTFMEVLRPRWCGRALVLAVQGVFFDAYFLISPKFTHRVVGYLEEETTLQFETHSSLGKISRSSFLASLIEISIHFYESP
ncbi:ubiquinol oxidase 1, mitochondrial-like [Syzygium oleosum]|uniref:ubiquinol oxidase 1, mitochondrial-like n=1 Tax=Syzygium oleosum TaxID=219896 RepID=UPI0011D1EDA7|nr:ubiquinol oxidase 1, mitochondrial-like [Syzygium oleosum]